ncbi:hypothetical protein [Sorangium sp. So ce1335]
MVRRLTTDGQTYWWRWKLRTDGPAQPSPPPSTEVSRFLPVHG